jgi:hypothetical protein
MRELLGIACVVVAAGCAQPETPSARIIAVTPSSERATSDIVPQFIAEGADGELRIEAMLFDRLVDEADSAVVDENTVELATPERLVAVIGDARVPLVGELFPVPGIKSPTVLWARYTATIADDGPLDLAIDFERADGTTLRSTMHVVAPFAVSALPESLKIGDRISFRVSPAPGADTWGSWDASCDATPDQTIYADDTSVHVAADGTGTLQLGSLRTSNADCAAHLRIRLYGGGAYDSAFGLDPTGTVSYQGTKLAVHISGL